MKRLLAILLLVLLPLHTAFAAAAGYCQHQKESPQAAHLGHHQHQHDLTADPSSGSAGLELDPDCGFCHLSSSSFVAPVSPALGEDHPPALAVPRIADFCSAIVELFHRPPRASRA
jgi:hypothetical protein